MAGYESSMAEMLDMDDEDDNGLADLETFRTAGPARASRPQSAHPSHRASAAEASNAAPAAAHDTAAERPMSALPLSALPAGRYQRLYGSAVSGHTRPKSCVPPTPSAYGHSARAVRIRSALPARPASAALLPHEQAATANAVRGTAGFSDAAAAPLGTAPKPRPYSAKLMSQQAAHDAQASARKTRLSIAAENAAAGRRGLMSQQTPAAPATPARADVGVQAAPVAWTRFFFADAQVQRALGARTAAGSGASSATPGGVGGPWLYMHLDARLRPPHERFHTPAAPVTVVSGADAGPAVSASSASTTAEFDPPSFGAPVYGGALAGLDVPPRVQEDWNRLHFASLECHIGADPPSAGGWPHASAERRTRAALDLGGGPVAIAGVGHDDVRTARNPEAPYAKTSADARRDVVQLAEYASRLWPRGREDALALIELLGGLVTTIAQGLRGADAVAQKCRNAAVKFADEAWRIRAARLVREAEEAKDVEAAARMAEARAEFEKEKEALRDEIIKIQRHSEYAAEDHRNELNELAKAKSIAERNLDNEKTKLERLAGEKEEMRDRMQAMRREQSSFRKQISMLESKVDPEERERIRALVLGSAPAEGDAPAEEPAGSA